MVPPEEQTKPKQRSEVSSFIKVRGAVSESDGASAVGVNVPGRIGDEIHCVGEYVPGLCHLDGLMISWVVISLAFIC